LRVVAWRQVAALLLAVVLLWPATGRAQAPAAIDQLLIEIRPEYDRPSALVIYWITLSPDSTLPASFSVRIPAAAGEPYAVGAGQGEGGVPLAATYERQVDGDWAIITVAAESRTVQVEFYADLDAQGDERQFTLTWPGGVSLGGLGYLIQHPVDSTNLQITPAPDSVTTGTDGLVYSRADLGAQGEAASATIQVAYIKPTARLSVDVLQPGAPLEATGPTEAIAIQDWLPWGLGGLGAILLGTVGVWYWRSSHRSMAGPRPRRRRPANREASQAQGGIDASSVFCHQCGAKADVSDHYCRRCGTRLRQ